MGRPVLFPVDDLGRSHSIPMRAGALNFLFYNLLGDNSSNVRVCTACSCLQQQKQKGRGLRDIDRRFDHNILIKTHPVMAVFSMQSS